MSDTKYTSIGSIGEFGLIERLGKPFRDYYRKSTVKGIGDDAAVIDGGEHYNLITTDMLVENIHFDLTFAPLKHVGYKAVTVNLSDIVAMNGSPEQVVVSVGLSSKFPVEAVEELYKGIKNACDTYKVDLVGGDTTGSLKGLIISVTAYGKVASDNVVYRNTAGKGDIVCVTGDLGGAYLGLQVLEREKEVFKTDENMQPQLEGYDYIIERQLKPEARLDVINQLQELQIKPTSMMDISDGLASELIHICRQSGTGVEINESEIPMDDLSKKTAGEFSLEPLTCTLNGGEDYELLMTINEKDMEKLHNHPDITPVGQIVAAEDGMQVVTGQGNRHPLKAQGWVHF